MFGHARNHCKISQNIVRAPLMVFSIVKLLFSRTKPVHISKVSRWKAPPDNRDLKQEDVGERMPPSYFKKLETKHDQPLMTIASRRCPVA